MHAGKGDGKNGWCLSKVFTKRWPSHAHGHARSGNRARQAPLWRASQMTKWPGATSALAAQTARGDSDANVCREKDSQVNRRHHEPA